MNAVGATGASGSISLGAVLRFEWTKLAGRRITWVPFLVLTLVVLIIVTTFHHLQFIYARSLFKTFGFVFQNKDEFVNGYYMTAHAMNPVFQLLMPIFISVAAGLMVAGEAEHGTLRACLVRPVSRTRLLLGKFVMLAGYSLALALFAIVLLTATGVLSFGTGNLYSLNILFNNGQEGASMVPAAEVPMRLVGAWLLATTGLMILAAMALLISALVESAAMAYVLTLSIYFAFLTLRSFPFLDWLYPYLFVTHMLRWQQCFYSFVKTGEIYVSLIHLAGYLIALLAAAVLLFEQRDIKN
ncbi:MAG: ABC transporter permease subunit [Planctomycetota bacterium]|nr:ABC transporter permease subunit [Planctomycetota bacterium]